MKCKICGKQYKHLGSHLWHKHGLRAREYKMRFGLDLNYPLIDASVKEKKQKHFEENREKYLRNIKDNKKTQFKKGMRNRHYFSWQTIHRLNQEQEKLKKQPKVNCPLCNLKCKAIYSHLYEKHGIVVVDKKKFWSAL